jgi:hypothetical protein
MSKLRCDAARRSEHDNQSNTWIEAPTWSQLKLENYCVDKSQNLTSAARRSEHDNQSNTWIEAPTWSQLKLENYCNGQIPEIDKCSGRDVA